MSEQPGTDTERDARLAALYRAAAHEGPPEALDEAIRAAAHRAVAAKPRLAGSPFSRSWRVPVSIAAVVMLSVTVVTMMREEVPGIMGTSHPEMSVSKPASERLPAESTPEFSTAPPRVSLSDGQPSSGVGLKASRSSSASGIGLRRDTEGGGSVTPLRKDAAPTGPPAGALPGQSGIAEAFPGASASRENTFAVAEPRQFAKEEAPRVAAPAVSQRQRAADPAPAIMAEANSPPRSEMDRRSADSAAPATLAAKSVAAPQAQNAPAPPPERIPMVKSTPPPVAATEKQATPTAGAIQAGGDLPPEKWLERIEALRKQGKVDEAKSVLQEFRKRYPNYRLPTALQEWAVP